MKTIKYLIILLASGALALQGCSGNGAAPAVHGELDTGTVIDPNNPSDIKVNVGGKIYFAKRDKKSGTFKITRPAATVNEGP